ncbi:Na+/H+ antiporter NhaA [Aestuariibaculum lutulentum]|uniref:Na(+)/H(+) antiporter NhaA n=1 Tax=Aestuariibaculum lutulentum TaxID=2920935 RepID=A0ABS9RH94_9FLAO|nr:Na+/H+ antiporter NhaA [Aestuariibaculum lutulentum]MCH4552299.1 Na+/H+ antiporter NhaA [Aestuariibaculum lutulentum]
MNKILDPINRFIKSSNSGSFLLLFTTALALIVANSPWSSMYHDLLKSEFTFGFVHDGFELTEPFYLWINDGLMAIFFFHVGLEIKREILDGELSSIRKASLPVIAALGGVIVPIIIYITMISNPELKSGWGVPMATDIAFSLGVLKLFGKRVPLGLKVFLTAFAIVDDLAAVVVIGVFYVTDINLMLILYSAVILLFMTILGMKKYFSKFIFFPLSVVVWILFLKSGIHPTIAGVLLAFTIPATRTTTLDGFFEKIKASLKRFSEEREHITTHHILKEEHVHAAIDIRMASESINSPLQKIEHDLHPWIVFFIMPVFAFANAGVSLASDSEINFGLAVPIAIALILGKFIGISLASWLAVKAKIAYLPVGVDFKYILGAALLGGLGFTMSLFIANLAFADEVLLSSAKVGILGGSLISGILGYLVIRSVVNKKHKEEKEVPVKSSEYLFEKTVI